MIPAAFDYVRPSTVEEAIELLSRHGSGAKVLAGGHSLLPAMKLRLAQPAVLIDIGRIARLREIREEGGRIAVGPLATHHEIASSPLLREKCPLLCEVAEQIGDVQVRNRGTIGGSLVHADPAADWPAAVLALEAELEMTGPRGPRTLPATKFFVDILQSAIEADEILTGIRVPATGKTVAYEKFAQKASGFALAGAAVVIEEGSVRVGITGVGARAYRAVNVEKALRGKPPEAKRVAAAAKLAAEAIDPLGDIHASAPYRAHLACVLTRRAIERALARA